MPTIVAMAYKYSIGEPFMNPRADLGYAANFLHMLFATPREEFRPNPVLVRALDRLFIVFADQGQDASTSTVRMAGSSGANPFACVSAAIACLSGPAHSGASEACLAMLQEIGDTSRLGGFVARARDKSDGFTFSGFGHPVYRHFDPRAQLLREVCDEVLQELGLEQHRLFALAKALEKLSLEDPYFVDEDLYPSVDFYSAILQKALGIPTSMFACVQALARTAGWVAQWEEMLAEPTWPFTASASPSLCMAKKRARSADSLRHHSAHHSRRRVEALAGRAAPAGQGAQHVPARRLPRPGNSQGRHHSGRAGAVQRPVPARRCRVSMCRAASTPTSPASISCAPAPASSTCWKTTCACRPACPTCWKTAR
jgi:hypothetical protein